MFSLQALKLAPFALPSDLFDPGRIVGVGRPGESDDPSARETSGESVPTALVSIIRRNLESIRDRIEQAAHRSGRLSTAVRLVAVTKRCPPPWVTALTAIGQRDLAENYPQELWNKTADPSLPADARWHLIGHLQSNKAKRTWPLVRLIHAVDSLKLLKTLDGLASSSPNDPSLCLQLNLSGEPSKHGWAEPAFLEDLDAIGSMPNARIVGLMTMSAIDATTDEARRTFERLRIVRDQAAQRLGRPLPDLSMGMSEDFEAAIAEGSTLVRIGSALFQGLKVP